MDLNFGDLKKEETKPETKRETETLSGAQDDNAHTEHYFANEQRDLDFGDPQAFVQRMSAGAREAQAQLEEKFARKADALGDLLGEAGKEVQQGIGGLTTDFMNAERGLFSAPLAPFSEAASAHTHAPPAAPPAAAPKQEEEEDEDLLGSFSEKPSAAPLQSFQPSAPSNANFHDDDDLLGTSWPTAPVSSVAAVANKDSDTESPSVSHTPSPAKKPIVDALKEQDNEKFISSEDLLSDFKDERTATPPAVPAHKVAPVSVPVPVPVPVAAPTSAAAWVTDLDDEEDFKLPAQAVPKAETKPEQPQPVTKPKEEPTKPKVAPPPVPAASAQPKIVSVEEIFYQYGLDAWFKPERLHPQVESLIYWRDVKKSGIVFSAGLITLVAISSFSVISVFAYLSLLTLFGTVAFRIYKSVTQAVQKTNDGHPFKEYLDLDLTLSQDKVQNIAGVAVAHVNGFVAELRRLFLVEDLIDSIKFGVILWVFTYIGAWFNGMTLVILAFVSLFTLPKVYENNKQSIDTYLDLVRSKLTEITDK
ncbi:hypothetical protein KR018_006976 [Drosophila ironensis]|nr:hypothetical protein KR018_006976 [Drosophila ironensis]